MFDRHPQTRREVAERTRDAMERLTAGIKSALDSSHDTDTDRERRQKYRYMVKGRYEGERMVWDVFQNPGQPGKPPAFVAGPFAFDAEAITYARDQIVHPGRLMIDFGKVRTVFRAPPGLGGRNGTNGTGPGASGAGLIVPDSQLAQGGREVRVERRSDGTILIGG